MLTTIPQGREPTHSSAGKGVLQGITVVEGVCVGFLSIPQLFPNEGSLHGVLRGITVVEGVCAWAFCRRAAWQPGFPPVI